METNTEVEEEKVVVGSKRKISKEKRFRQNVKGFAKKGNFGNFFLSCFRNRPLIHIPLAGRGSYLEEEQAKYFLNILDVLNEDFETVEVKRKQN